MSKELDIRPPYVRPAEGVAVVLRYKDNVAVVRHAENPDRNVHFGAYDLPRETRERNNGYFEPLTTTLRRTLREELGITDEKRKESLKTVGYATMDCERPDGKYIKAHIVVMNSSEPLSVLTDPAHVDTTEIIGTEEIPLFQALTDPDAYWRPGPDGRDLIRAALPNASFDLKPGILSEVHPPLYDEGILINHD